MKKIKTLGPEFFNHQSIFPVLDIDRKVSRWEEHLNTLTPVDEHKGIFFKREDLFAPLGYGSINGSKLRQCIWLMNKEAAKKRTHKMMITGASIKSPQLPMGTAVARHYGFDTICVIGSTKPETAIKKDTIQLAAYFGAKFSIQKIAYSKQHQVVCQKMKADSYPDGFFLEQGITIDHAFHPMQDVYEFHAVGAHQTQNIPDDVTTLILPAGSCNSATSILLGLAINPPKRLKNIHLIGIGPSKLKYLEQRLAGIQELTGIDCGDFRKKYNVQYYDLHGSKWVDYQDEMYYYIDNIEFHPTYEAKCLQYVEENMPELFAPGTLFWVVGSKPRMEFTKKVRGEYPEEIEVI